MTVYFNMETGKLFVSPAHLDMYLHFEHLIWIGDI